MSEELKRQPEIFSDAILLEQFKKIMNRVTEIAVYLKDNPKDEQVRVYMTQWLQNLNAFPEIREKD